jgi:dihydrofolate reductase
MRTVIFSMSVSLDGFTAGPGGDIDWAAPDEDLMRFHNDQTREIGAHLCGRGLYEDMLPWETTEHMRSEPLAREFAQLWKAIPKVVFSTTLRTVEGNARLARGTVADEIAGLEEHADSGVISVGGAGFASSLIGMDLIDEYRLFVNPVVLGGGTPYFPPGAKLDLRLIETRTFGSRVVYLRYRRGAAEHAWAGD